MTSALTLKNEEFVPKEGMCNYDRERDGGEDRDLDAARNAGDPYEKIEYAEAQQHIQYSYESISHELPTKNSLQKRKHL